MIRNYSFGGIVFAMETDFELSESNDLEQFRVSDDTQVDYRIEAVTDGSLTAVERRGNHIRVPVKKANVCSYTGVQLLLGAHASFLFNENDGFILHAAYVVCDGKALLITAPSGTGKSTLASHWIEAIGGEVVNGDRVLVMRRDGIWYANGIYVAGTSGICQNKSVPIGHIVLIEQGEKNEVMSHRPHELFMRTVNQCSYDIDLTESCAAITSMIADLINAGFVSCYSCRNDIEAAIELEKRIWIKK